MFLYFLYFIFDLEEFLNFIFSSFFLYFVTQSGFFLYFKGLKYTFWKSFFLRVVKKSPFLQANSSFFSLAISSNFQLHWQIVWYVSILPPKLVFFSLKYSSIFSSIFLYFGKKYISLFFSKPRTTPGNFKLTKNRTGFIVDIGWWKRWVLPYIPLMLIFG